MRPRMKAAVWRTLAGRWVTESCLRGDYQPEQALRERVPSVDWAERPTESSTHPTHAEALAHALRVVGLAPKEDR